MAEARTRLIKSNRNAPQQVAISRANLQSKQAQANAAKAGVDKALLDLSYTNVLAPVSGVIGKRSVEVGSTVQAGQQLFTIAQIGDIWVTANFKETQLQRMRPGLQGEDPRRRLRSGFQRLRGKHAGRFGIHHQPAAAGKRHGQFRQR